MKDRILNFPLYLLNGFINSRFFALIVSNQIISTIALVSIVVFFSFPSYDVAFITTEMDGIWSAFFLQSENPFVNNNPLYGHGSHEEKLAFRFVPALILGALHIHTKAMAMFFQFGTVVLFYYLLIRLFNVLFVDTTKAFVYAIPFCLVYAGHVYVSDYKGVFDTLALCFLLLSVIVRLKIYVIIPLLLAYFTDERALIASPAIGLFLLYEQKMSDNLKLVFHGALSKHVVYLILSWLIYFALRYSLHIAFGLTTGTGGTQLFFEQMNKSIHTLYVGLEAFLIPFCLVIWALIKRRQYAFFILLLICFFALYIVAQSVIDSNRSMSYVVLLLILIIRLFDDFFSEQIVWKIIAWVIVLNLVYGDTYPFLAQLFRMKFITGSI